MPPRLHRECIPRHDNRVGKRAVALGAAEPEVLQRHIAAPAVDDGLQVGRCLVMARLAPYEQAQPGVLVQHRAGGREGIGHFAGE